MRTAAFLLLTLSLVGGAMPVRRCSDALAVLPADFRDEALLFMAAAIGEDDTARLVYADWLDEHDRPAEAAYLRRSVLFRRLSGHQVRRFPPPWRSDAPSFVPNLFDGGPDDRNVFAAWEAQRELNDGYRDALFGWRNSAYAAVVAGAGTVEDLSPDGLPIVRVESLAALGALPTSVRSVIAGLDLSPEGPRQRRFENFADLDFPNLAYLKIDRIPLNRQTLQALARRPRLRLRHLSWVVPITQERSGRTPIPWRLPALVTLDLCLHEHSAASLSRWEMPNLRALSLDGSAWGASFSSWNLPKLEWLSLEEASLTDEDLPSLVRWRLPSLRTLRANGMLRLVTRPENVGDWDLPPLRRLELGRNRLSHLSFLDRWDLSQLAVLDVHRNFLGRVGLELLLRRPLPALVDLRARNIGDGNPGDVAEPFAGWQGPSLRHLDLRENAIGWAGHEALRQMKAPALTSLLIGDR